MVDLNRDGRLDLVMVNRTRLRVWIQQADADFGVVSIAKPLVGGRAVAIGDVNGDRYPDIYVVQGATGAHEVANPPDIMYLNDGGTALTKVPIPETSRGNGAAVSPLDYNNDGTTDFLVTNGARGLAGPVQLISFPPPVAAHR